MTTKTLFPLFYYNLSRNVSLNHHHSNENLFKMMIAIVKTFSVKIENPICLDFCAFSHNKFSVASTIFEMPSTELKKVSVSKSKISCNFRNANDDMYTCHTSKRCYEINPVQHIIQMCEK